MTHRLLALALLTLAATSAFGYAEPRLDPSSLTIKVGEKARVDVSIQHLSGWNQTMWSFFFTSSDDTVMVTHGREFTYPRWNGSIEVEGIRPGVADIMAGRRAWGRVVVVCGEEAPIAALDERHIIPRGGSALLSVTSTASGRVLRWYAGRIGDTSHPLDGTTTDYLFTSSAPGTYYVWVSASTPCSTSAAEFRIDVTKPRGRAVRRR